MPVLYDPVGDDYAEPALRAMNWQGRYFGRRLRSRRHCRVPLNLTLLKGCDVLGVFWGAATARNPHGAFADLNHLAAWIAEGKLKPHIWGVSHWRVPAKPLGC